jgi:CheY-like chemotaxis protein
LVVDDTEELREQFVEVIDTLGFPVASATDGAQALRMLPDLRPGVILLDMNMPELDGLGVLRRLRGMTDVPVVIAMSADRDFASITKELGAFDFLQKPIDITVLDEALSAASRGRPLGDADHARHSEYIAETYAADDARRDELLGRSGIDAPSFHREVASMLEWLSSYFAMPFSFVILLRNGRPTLFESVGVPGLQSGMDVSDRFCGELTRNNESLIISDASSHPLYHEHDGVKATFRAYVSTPIRTRDALSIGTLTLKSPNPLDAQTFGAEELGLLRYFAEALGEQIQQSATDPAFSGPALIAPAELRAALRQHR